MPIDLSNIKTTRNRGYNTDDIEEINDSLYYLPDKQRASVLATIIEESGGNPLKKSKNGTYQGLLQWESDRYKIKSGNRREALKNQLQYLKNTIYNTTDKKSWTHGGKGSGYDSLVVPFTKFHSTGLPLDSVYRGFSYGYVRPEGKEESYQNRLKVAKQVLDRYPKIPDYLSTPGLFDKIKFENMGVSAPKAEGGSIETSKRKLWHELSQAEKSEMMKVAIKNGVTNLQEIKQKYNEFAQGGDMFDKDYYSIMYKVAEENNPIWNTMRREEGAPELSVDAEYTRILNDNTYDYRGYYNKYPDSKANADTHWTDEFKTVWHPTFSVESRYSGKKSEFNPLGLEGGIPEKHGQPFIPVIWQRHEANRYAEGGPLVEVANIYGLGDWLKGLFSHRKQILYKAADGKVFSTAKEASEHNGILVKEGKLYPQRESKTLGVKSKLVPRKPNTSSTSAKSTILENSMYLRLDANRERTGYRTKAYDIPYGTKEIKVKPKDTTLPFNISVNALDSVAKYAGVTDTPIETALGLPYQETTFGRNPLYNYESLGNKYSATDLGNANYFKAFGSIPAEYLVRDFRYNGDLLIDGKRDKPISIETPPLQHAFEYFNTGNYNRRANNHTGKVKAAGKSLWNETTGSLQNWWNTEGKEWYSKGTKQRKK